MTNVVAPGPTRLLARRRKTHLDLGGLSVFLPVPIGLCVGLLSLSMGTDPIYVALQILLFLLITPVLYLLKYDEKYTPAIILASFTKNFYLSQIICIFVWHRPDTSLLNAELTEVGMVAGLVSATVGVLLARLAISLAPRTKPLLSWDGSPDELRQLGYLTAIIGLPCQILWTIHIAGLTDMQHGGVGIQSTGAPILAFLAPLALVSICCFAAEQLLRSERRSFLSYRSMAVMAVYFAAILPLATKAAPLLPVVAISVVALVYRWRPRLAPILGGLALFVVVMEFFYPAITLARMTAFTEHRSVPIVFGEIAVKSIVDPAELSYVREYSDSFELGIKQTYFGRPLGFWDRFTPQQTDRLISGSQYVQPSGDTAFQDALYEILPQFLGFKKNLIAQTRLEIALDRQTQARGEVSWANSGYVGGGFVSGGIVMAIIFCLTFGFGTSLVSRLTFIYKQADVLWIPLMVTEMFTLADSGFVSGAYPYFWSTAIPIGSTYILLRYMRRGKPLVSR